MSELRSTAQEAAEDIFFGQEIVIWARWFVITAAAVVLLFTSTTIAEMTIGILMLLPLVAINFFTHGRYLVEKPVNQYLLAALSAIDIAIITLMVLWWQEDTGLASPYFIFYYPVVLAFAFVFPPRIAVIFTLVTLTAYSVACLVDSPLLMDSSLERERLVMRLITLASMGGLGTFYWRIQRKRRRGAEGSRSPATAGA